MATTTYIVLKELMGNPPPQLGLLQKVLLPHVHFAIALWQILWFLTALIMLALLMREYWRERREF